jgi:hypothetical protein
MNRSTMIRPIEPGDCVYVRGHFLVFLVLDVYQGQALVGNADSWVKHKGVPLDICHLVEEPDR